MEMTPIVYDVGMVPIFVNMIVEDERLDVYPRDSYHRVEIRLVKREPAKWAICDGHDCLTKDGEWVFQSLPSSRTEAFLESTRFDSAEAAFEFWKQYRTQEIIRAKELGLKLGREVIKDKHAH